jgi:hypothetical protein
MTDAIKISNALVEAYKGYYEGERIVQQDDGSFKDRRDFTDKEWEIWIKWRIVSDLPKTRLTLYLNWNGILGYEDSIFDIATGKLA